MENKVCHCFCMFSFHFSPACRRKADTFPYTEVHLDFWVIAILVAITIINLVFFFTPRMNMQGAMLLVYVYTLFLFALSNGILLSPIQVTPKAPPPPPTPFAKYV